MSGVPETWRTWCACTFKHCYSRVARSGDGSHTIFGRAFAIRVSSVLWQGHSNFRSAHQRSPDRYNSPHPVSHKQLLCLYCTDCAIHHSTSPHTTLQTSRLYPSLGFRSNRHFFTICARPYPYTQARGCSGAGHGILSNVTLNVRHKPLERFRHKRQGST